ncbi:MAG: T9SS type A sorting domain-containing protein [Bacteroidota bacterium]
MRNKKLLTPTQLTKRGEYNPKLSLNDRLRGYALLATGLALVPGKVAKAEVVYTDPADIIITTDLENSEFTRIDLDGDGTDDVVFEVELDPYEYNYIYNYPNYVVGEPQIFNAGTGDFNIFSGRVPFTLNDPINASDPAWSNAFQIAGFEYMSDNPPSDSNWGNLPASGYLAFGLNQGGGDYNYGWIRVRFEKVNTLDLRLTVFDWAYENVVNEQILTGQTSGGVVLPVELTAFTASSRDGQVLLEWKTETEIDNEGFDILRSTDGKSWEKLGFIKGYGTTYEAQNYRFIDDQPIHGENYYRLKQIDTDGTFEFTNIVSAQFTAKQEVNLYPNPVGVNGLANMTFASASELEAELIIFNAEGKEMARTSHQLFVGDNTLEIATSQWQPGTYFVRLLAPAEGLDVYKRLIIL